MDSISRTPADLIGDDHSGEQPRARDSLFLLAQLKLHGRPAAREVRVRNLSEGGLMAEFDGRVAMGETLEIELRGIGRVTGRIAWATEGRIGVAFDKQIDPMKARKPVGTRR